MAKVTGPLFSMGASGKIGNAMVFFSHLGRNVVRKWLVPRNAESVAQGDQRQIFGGLGRSTRAIGLLSPYHTSAKLATPTGSTFVSELVSYILRNYMQTALAYEAQITELEAHTAFADFVSEAAAANLTDFSVTYAGTTEVFTGALQLYMLAKYGIAKRDVSSDIFNASPFDTALATWTVTEIGELGTYLETV